MKRSRVKKNTSYGLEGMTRREVLGHAYAMGASYAVMPAFAHMLLNPREARAAGAYPKYSYFHVHGAGGCAVQSFIQPRTADGGTPADLQNFAGTAPGALAGISTLGGTPFWNTASVKSGTGAINSPFFEGLMGRLNLVPGAAAAVLASSLFYVTNNDSTSGCKVSITGSIGKILSDLGINPKAGVVAAGLTNTESLNGTGTIYPYPSLSKNIPTDASSLYSVMEFSKTLSAAVSDPTNRQNIINKLAPTIGDYAAAIWSAKLGTTPQDKRFLEIQAKAYSDLNTMKEPNPTYNATALNPATNASYATIAETVLGTFPTSGGVKMPTTRQAFLFNVAYGVYLATGFNIGGCDYHNNAPTSTMAKDKEIGDAIGCVLALTYAMRATTGMGIIIHFSTDGAVAANVGNLGNPAAPEWWRGDNNGGSGGIAFVIPAPGQSPAVLRQYLGAVDPTSGATLNNTLFGTGPSAGYAMLLNWLNLNGYSLDLADSVAGSAGIDPTLIAQMKTKALLFG